MPATTTPRTSMASRFVAYIKAVLTGSLSLFTGMGVTLSYLLQPKRIITEQYPENRATLKMHPRYRGMVTMPHDENGDHKCTACGLCERACPNGTISVLTTRSLSGQKVLGRYIYRFSQCTLCGLCIEACPYDAIRMSPAYETATIDKPALDLILNKKEGRS